MKIKLTQTFDIQDFLFQYTKEDLNKLLSSDPNIIQNGSEMQIYVDTVEITTQSGKRHVSLESLKDEEFRKYLIDSLNKHDQITFGLKSFSDTDSLYLKLHLGLDDSAVLVHEIDRSLTDKSIRWGNKKIDFTRKFTVQGRRLNIDHTVTDEELFDMLDQKIEVSLDSKNFVEFPEDAEISFSVRRANNTKLARLDSERWNKLKESNNVPESSIDLVGYYHGKKYTIQEEYQSFTLSNFYLEKESFKQWISTCQNGDHIMIKIDDPGEEYGNYYFNLRYRDDNEAISAPFPVDLPHTRDSYSNFQLIMNDEGNSYVRLDKTDPRNKKIVDAYASSESYEVIHIDDFKTKYRVKEQTLPSGQLENEIIDNPEISNLNILRINDYYTEEDELVRMDWGKMVSMPNIGNYSIKEFKRSSKGKMTLFVGTNDMDMKRFDLLIIPENGKIKRIRTDKVNTPGIRETLNDVGPNTSIYVDNIIVDIDGDLRYYPYNFVFTVE